MLESSPPKSALSKTLDGVRLSAFKYFHDLITEVEIQHSFQDRVPLRLQLLDASGNSA